MVHFPAYLESASRQRRHLLAGLAAERAGLLWQLVGLDERMLVELPVFNSWTAKDVLAHIAAWDEVVTERIECVVAGREEEIIVFTGADEDARNAAFHAERKDWSLRQTVDTLMMVRADFLAAQARLPDEAFYRLRHFPEGEAPVHEWAQWRARHDVAHAADLATWRERLGLERGVGPKQVLLAGLTAAREALLVAAALVPPEERTSLPVCGEWTLKDVLAHVVDWEWIGVAGLRDMAAGRSPQVEPIEDIDAWNRVHAEARHDQPWEEVWADLHEARGALLETLDGMGQAGLGGSFSFPWGQKGTAYWWVCVYVAHDREHAEGLREAVGAE